MKFPWSQKELKDKEVKKIFPEKDLSDIKAKFVKVCTNGHLSNGTYKNKDYIKWAKEAADKGEAYFYTELADPKKPFGPKKLSSPKYEWRLVDALTEEEYRRLFPNE